MRLNNGQILNEHESQLILLQTALHASNDGIIALKVLRSGDGSISDFVVLFSNAAYKKIWGGISIKPGSSFLELLTSAEQSGYFDKYVKIFKVGKAAVEVIRNPIRDEVDQWFYTYLIPVKDGLICIWSDISENKNAAEQILKKLASFQFEEVTNSGGWEYEIGKNEIFWTAGMYAMFGINHGTTVYPETYLNFVVPEDRGKAEKMINKIKNEFIPFEEQLTLTIAGKQKVLHIKGSPYQSNGGKILRMNGIDIDITERVKIQTELKEQNHFIHQVAQATPDIINIYDLRSKSYVYFNKEVFSYVGYTSSEIQMMNVEERNKLLFPDDQQLLRKFYEDFKNSDNDEIRELEFRLKNIEGKWWWFKSRSKVFKRDEGGRPIQVISILQDFQKNKEAEEKARENEIMRSLLIKKDEFMSVASHELKTPVTTLKASLQLLQRKVEKDDRDDTTLVHVDRAIHQLNKVIALINDLMDNSKIQAGKIVLRISLCPVDEIIADVISQNSNEKEIIVRNRVHQPIEVDKLRIEQVLVNFVANAIKYSPGQSRVIVTAVQENNFVKITVQDFGIGIPQEKIPYLFDRFFRVDDSSTSFSGLGLGLYISAEIIKLHHGEYGVVSEEGKGSTFWFTVPVKYAES